MKVLLINDTSSCHAGSKQVMENLRYHLRKHEIVKTIKVSVDQKIDGCDIDGVDWVVVNAEGSIHHNSPWGIEILETLDYAQFRGKKTFLLNALYEKMDSKFDDIIRRCDVVMAREKYSYDNLIKLNSKTELHPDFCVLNFRGIKGKVIDVGVHSGVCKTQTHFASVYKNVFDTFRCPIVSIGSKHSFDDYIATYKNMDVLLTGQHHAVYACILAGTSFVPTFGNSHKIESFLEWMDIPVMMCSTNVMAHGEILNIKGGKYKEHFDKARTKLLELSEKLYARLEVLF